MSLKKRKSRGGGRQKFKRKKGIEDTSLEIGQVWKTPLERAQAILRHRESVLKIAETRGYHAAAISRLKRKVDAAEREIERFDKERFDRENAA